MLTFHCGVLEAGFRLVFLFIFHLLHTSGLRDDDVPAPTSTLAATDAYEQAGLGPGDLDVVECQDTNTTARAAVVRGAGPVRARRIGRVDGLGRRRAGGRLPVNPSGGLLSKGEPLGASALGQVVELVRQLRGECGPRQVEGARQALSHTVGRGANASVVLLARAGLPVRVLRLHIHPVEGSGDGLCGFDQETKEPITVTHTEIIYRRRIAVLAFGQGDRQRGGGVPDLWHKPDPLLRVEEPGRALRARGPHAKERRAPRCLRPRPPMSSNAC